MWFWPGTQVFKENWWNTLWSSSTSPAYLFPFPFLSCKLFSHTTEVSHLFSTLHTYLLSIQSPDLHHNFSHLFIYVFSPFGTVTWLFLFKKQIHLIPATSLVTVFLPLLPLSSQEICIYHVCQQFCCTNFSSRIFLNQSSACCTTMKLCYWNNFLLAKLHPHAPLPASLFQCCCLFSSLLKYFPSLVSVTAFFSGSPLLFQVSTRQLPSSVSKFLFLCLRSSYFISMLLINILKFIPHSLASILLKNVFLSRSEKGYYFSAFESNNPTQA